MKLHSCNQLHVEQQMCILACDENLVNVKFLIGYIKAVIVFSCHSVVSIWFVFGRFMFYRVFSCDFTWSEWNDDFIPSPIKTKF